MAGACAAIGFVGFILLFVIGVGFIAVAHNRRMQAQWVEYASARGMQLSGHFPMIQLAGALHGVGVSMVTHRHVRHSRRGRRVSYTHELIATPRMHLGDLAISREGFFASVGKVFGGQDIQTGNHAFDRAFVIKSQNEHAARLVLTPAVMHALLTAQSRLADVFVEAGGVRVIHQGTASPATLDAQLDTLARVAVTFGT